MINNEEKLKELESLEERISQLKKELEITKTVTMSMEELYNTFPDKTAFTNHLYKMKMLNTETIRDCSRIIDWKFLEQYYHFSLSELNEFHKLLTYFNLTVNTYNNMSLDLVKRRSDELNWDRMSYSKLSKSLIKDFSDRLNWKTLSLNVKFTEEEIEEYSDRLDWSHITLSQELSEEFIIKHHDKLDPRFIAFHKPSKETLSLFKERMEILDKEIIEKQKKYQHDVDITDENKLFLEEWKQSYGQDMRIEGSGNFDIGNKPKYSDYTIEDIKPFWQRQDELSKLEKESIDDQTDFQSGAEEEEEVSSKEEESND